RHASRPNMTETAVQRSRSALFGTMCRQHRGPDLVGIENAPSRLFDDLPGDRLSHRITLVVKAQAVADVVERNAHRVGRRGIERVSNRGLSCGHGYLPCSNFELE